MGIAMLFVGLGFFRVLLWNFVVYALPAFVGLNAGFWAFNHGAGIGAVIIGLAAGAVMFIAARFTVTNSHRPIRWMVIAIFALPAAYAGYHMMLDLAQAGISSAVWQHIFAVVAGIATGTTTVARLSEPVGQM